MPSTLHLPGAEIATGACDDTNPLSSTGRLSISPNLFLIRASNSSMPSAQAAMQYLASRAIRFTSTSSSHTHTILCRALIGGSGCPGRTPPRDQRASYQARSKRQRCQPHCGGGAARGASSIRCPPWPHPRRAPARGETSYSGEHRGSLCSTAPAAGNGELEAIQDR